MLQLLGGQEFEGVDFTTDQFRAIQRLYGFVPEKPNKKPPPPVMPELPTDRWEATKVREDHARALEAHKNWQDPRVMMQAGADRNAMRAARHDGLRVMAWLSRHLAPGQDPVKVLIQMANDAGWGDVDPADTDWAEQDEDEEAAE